MAQFNFIKFIRGFLASLILLNFLSFSIASTVHAQDPKPQSATDSTISNLDGLEEIVTGEKPNVDRGRDRVGIALAGIMEAVLSLVGIVLIILIVYAGILWMTARGNDEQVERARKYIANAVIGLIIVLMAYTLTIFVVQQLTSAVFESRFSPY